MGHISAFKNLLELVVDNPKNLVSDLIGLSKIEADEINAVAIAQPSDFPDTTVIKLFEDKVRDNPNKIALYLPSLKNTDECSFTYSQVNQRANQIASAIQARGVGQGDLVVILLERGFNMLTSLLGVVKAGAVFVPLDPTFPQDRLAYMMADCDSKLVIC